MQHPSACARCWATRAGIYNFFQHPAYNQLVFKTDVGHTWTPQEILDTFAHTPYFEPGTGYHYSNTNFVLLGFVIQAVTGEAIGDVLAERFFEPLGLADTYFQGCGTSAARGAAEGYLESTSGPRAISDGTDYRPTISAATVAWAAGAIDASAHDIAVWGNALYGGHLTSPQTLAQMEDWTFYPDQNETYGLGTRSIGHRRRACLRPYGLAARLLRRDVVLRRHRRHDRRPHQPGSHRPRTDRGRTGGCRLSGGPDDRPIGQIAGAQLSAV